MTPLFVLHVFFSAAWLGCVLTEVLFERALAGKGSAFDRALAALHWRVDLIVEVPAFVGATATGGLLLRGVEVGPVLGAKIVFGIVAAGANVVCTWLVYRRHDAATGGREGDFERLDRLQHRWGTVVFVGLVGAAVLGVIPLAATGG